GYLTLYTPETLAGIPDDADLRRRELAGVAGRLGLALAPEAVALPGLPLKRAQIFAYDERPLGQVAYLDPSSGPLALCITTGAGPGAGAGPALREERREGFNIVFWDTGRHRLMLIGRAPFERLRSLASLLASRLPA
ncbi:MAG: anti-sigma factor, partial [Microvirga sp.]